MIINIAARSSKLSIAQVNEVLTDLKKHFSDISFKTHFLTTKGDRDKKKSLRNLEKTDFFTKEIDDFILNKKNYIAIHSAKDLPEEISKNLKIVAYTKGVSFKDVIVTRDDCKFLELKPNSIIASSSYRRDKMVKAIRSDLKFVDIRGTIEERLEILNSKKVDAVVIAEAAIIRLKLNLNYYLLDSKTVKGQGQLAIVANRNDQKMDTIFSKLNYGLII